MQQVFYQSCSTGDTEQVKRLLTPPVIDALLPPSTNPNLSYSVLLYNYAIHVACKHHHTEVIRLLLTYEPMKPYIDFTISNYYALRTICREGFADIVRLILHYYPFPIALLHINISYFANIAKEYGHVEIVRILETPLYYDIFCRDTFIDDKVETGIRLLSYQDILQPSQRAYVISFMTAWLIRMIPLPKDIIGYICRF